MAVECQASCGNCEHAATDPCEGMGEGQGIQTLDSTFRRAAQAERFKPQVLASDPWIVVLDEFVDAQAAAALASAGEAFGFSPIGSACGNNLAACTTSTFVCETPECEANPSMRRFRDSMLEVLGLPDENCEPLGIFRYREGQGFGLHHDQESPVGLGTPGGPRTWSMYVFLSDVERGGGTRFPDLNVTITPKVGRAFLWPHVLAIDYSQPDLRTKHEGLRVGSGTKYGARIHCHAGNVRTLARAGCPLTVGVVGTKREASTPLHDSAALGLTDLARAALTAGASASDVDRDGATALHLAAMHGHAAVCQLLLQHGASHAVDDPNGATPLHWAAHFGHVAAARCMLEHGADPNEAQLHWAAAAGHADLVEVLIAAGARVDGHDAGGRTPLAYVEHPAWKHVGHTDVARVLRRASSLSKRRRKQRKRRKGTGPSSGGP